MRVTDKTIVLQAVPYGDKKLILKLFCREQGLMTAAVVKGSSPTSKVKAAHIRPMNLLDACFTKKQNKEIQQLTEANCYYIYDHLPASLHKLSIAQFLNEVMLKTIREHSQNSGMFDFVEGCVKFLNENEKGYMNLHIYFLIEWSKFLGFSANNNFSDTDRYFDCREGQFSSVHLPFPLGLDEDASALLARALRTNSLEEKFSNTQRQSLLESLAVFYQHHVPGFNHLKSLGVLKEVASA